MLFLLGALTVACHLRLMEVVRRLGLRLLQVTWNPCTLASWCFSHRLFHTLYRVQAFFQHIFILLDRLLLVGGELLTILRILTVLLGVLMAVRMMV